MSTPLFVCIKWARCTVAQWPQCGLVWYRPAAAQVAVTGHGAGVSAEASAMMTIVGDLTLHACTPSKQTSGPYVPWGTLTIPAPTQSELHGHPQSQGGANTRGYILHHGERSNASITL